MILDMFNESTLFGGMSDVVEENYLEGVDAIPLQEGEDPVSACYRITMENEQNWFNIVNTIAYSELAFMESHGPEDVMYEAADIKKIKDTIVAWIQQQWAKLKGVITSAIQKLSSLIKGDARLIKAYIAARSKDPAIENKTVTIKKGAFIKGIGLSDIENLAEDVSRTAHSDFDKLWNFNSYTSDADCKGIIEEFKDKKISYSGDTLKAVKDGYVSSEPQKVTGKEAYAVVNAGNHAKALQKMFDKEKKAFNDMISTFKKEKNDLSKEAKSNASSIITLKSKYCKVTISALNNVARICIKAANSDYHVHRAALNALIKGKVEADNQKDGKKATNESVDLICNLI